MHLPLAIRSARPEDHADFARFFVELGHDDPIPSSSRWELEMMPHTFFLEEAGTKAAYAFVENYGERGYIRHVVVEPDRRGRGLGGAMMNAIAADLRARGAKEWELNVRTGNDAAIRLYESCGMRAEYSTFVLRFEWSKVHDAGAPTRTLRIAQVQPEHDTAIESAFDLPSGMVARLRSFQGHVLIQLLDELDEPIAFARFDPEFPGAFPFRVADAELAVPLLEALRPHAGSNPGWIQLVIENDEACAERLRKLGARLRFEILHMRGTIPL
jgi:GNAT superfamily N-acetyltransferase